jgi:hypothetical protein
MGRRTDQESAALVSPLAPDFGGQTANFDARLGDLHDF